ncbi:MAG TPA: magnesium-translocating P-type ATPase [Syntrophales bacterium]|nr:magnesium-translocating P-type ATPase [Syntrophales bacterium]
MPQIVDPSDRFWAVSSTGLILSLQSSEQGLTKAEAADRLAIHGKNLLKTKKRTDIPALLLSQFSSPIILILIFAAVLSFFLGDLPDAVIILVIVGISGLLGFWQEWRAADAMEKLLEIVEVKADVLRDGIGAEIPMEEVVPGDVALLRAGDTIPGDCLILESKDLFVDEAALTGETFPVDKSAGVLPTDTPLAARTNALFMGTHVVSGTARALVVNTGLATEFGRISERLQIRPPETEFEIGVRRFGFLLLEVTLLIVILIFGFNVYLRRPVMESFLFAMALAVGLTPQLLPAIITVNLSHGARRMAQKRVIVKRLASIENFGSMNILCSDKTGTITEGSVRLREALDLDGARSEPVLLHAFLNSSFETGFPNPIDNAVRAAGRFDLTGYEKLDEVPYDFVRKRLSILVATQGGHRMITKGAFRNVLDACSTAATSAVDPLDIGAACSGIEERFEDLSRQGFRVLGVASREMGETAVIGKESEADMTFLGFLVFEDPPKAGVAATITKLRDLGVSLKIITGDNGIVAASIGRQVGLDGSKLVTGRDLRTMSNEALVQRLGDVQIFAEIEPNQKERIIRALKTGGNVVGYMGDGINDASALHASDVSISVEGAVDVAKEAADIVLLDRSLDILVDGVREGRKTFANTMKYVFMATSANFGNMFSMAGASLFLPFLPLLPTQILLTNLLTDFPEMTISTDSVDAELSGRPQRWDIRFIRNFMIVFGILSSVFDYLTFGVLLFILHATPELFRTGWFMESVISASLIVLVIRTRKPFFRSLPGRLLCTATLLVGAATLLLPFTPLGALFEFRPIPIEFIALMGVIIAFYVLAAEAAKRLFYARMVTPGGS